MATHALWQADVADFDAWLEVFRKDAPARHAAGIHELHVWRDPERADHAVALFEIRDIEKARAFIESEELAVQHEAGGVAHITVKLLTPA